MQNKMTFRTRVVTVNLGILAGLVVEYYMGKPPAILVFTGLVLYLIANLMLYIKSRHDQV